MKSLRMLLSTGDLSRLQKKKKEKKNPQRIKYSKPREPVVISIIIFEGIIISRVQTRNNLFLISFIPKVSISS